MIMKPYRILNQNSKAPFFISCEHATGRIPKQFGTLGLKVKELSGISDHFDKGAEFIARRLSHNLRARCMLSSYSRLVVDLNRGLDHPDIVKTHSFGKFIPMNQNLSALEKTNRIKSYYAPYHRRMEKEIDALKKMHDNVHYISVHSFSGWIKGKGRDADIGLMYNNSVSLKLAKVIKKELEKSNLKVKLNEPYSGYSNLAHCLQKYGKGSNVHNLQIEVNDNHFADAQSAIKITNLLTDAVEKAVQA